MNDQDAEYLKTRHSFHLPQQKYEVLIPFESKRDDINDILLDRTEIQARIYDILRQMDLMPLEQFDFDADYQKELGLDSLEWTAIVTSIENEFHTVFQDSLYEHYRTVNEFVDVIAGDHSCF